MAERAAAALAMHRLHDRQRDGIIRRTHHELLVGLLADPAAPDLLRRCEVAGLPISKRQFIGLIVRPVGGPPTHPAPSSRMEEVIAATVHATHELKAPALVSNLEGDVRVLLSLPSSANPHRQADALGAQVQRRHSVVVGAGQSVSRPAEIDRTLREARHVVDSVRADDLGRIGVHRLDDVGVRGLLAMLADDERLRLYVERQMGALRVYDRESQSNLESVIRALLTHPSSKSDAAASLHMSRPVFYDRIAKAERVLGAGLDDPDTRVSLHVALLADEIAQLAKA